MPILEPGAMGWPFWGPGLVQGAKLYVFGIVEAPFWVSYWSNFVNLKEIDVVENNAKNLSSLPYSMRLTKIIFFSIVN